MSAWISKSQALAVTGWTYRWLKQQVATKRIVARPSSVIGSNGHPVREYEIDSFPEEFRSKLLTIASVEIETIRPQLPFPQAPMKLAFANEEEERQAKARFEAIEPLVNFDRRRDEYALLRLGDGTPVTSASRMAKLLSEQRNISERNLWRMVTRFKEGGLVGLADRKRSDKGKSRFFDTYKDAAAVAAYMFLNRRDSIRSAHNAIVRHADILNIAEADVPSYETVRTWLQGASPALKSLARDGRRAYVERMSPYVSRGYVDVWPNEIWVSDHMIHDVEVMNDCFHEAEIGAPIRLRFTCLLDFRSRYVVGWAWAWEGSSRSIATAMRHAVLKHGPCDIFYCDNGKDYRKVAKGAMPAYLRESQLAPSDWYDRELANVEELGVMARLDIMVQHCMAYHPQSKHVERFFRTLHTQFDAKWPTYTSGNSATRPDFTTVAMADHRRLMRMGLVHKSLHPKASDFIRMCLAWIEEYNRQPHTGRGMEGQSPEQVFFGSRKPNQRPAPAPQDLAVLLTERQRRKVSECSVRIDKRRYLGVDEGAVIALHEMNELDVLVAYDPLDMEEVAVLDLDGNLIAWARAEQYLTQSPQANAAIASSMIERRRLEKSQRELLGNIAQAARQIGVKTDLEVLAENALPAAANDVVTQRKPQQQRRLSGSAAPALAINRSAFADKFLEDE